MNIYSLIHEKLSVVIRASQSYIVVISEADSPDVTAFTQEIKMYSDIYTRTAAAYVGGLILLALVLTVAN